MTTDELAERIENDEHLALDAFLEYLQFMTDQDIDELRFAVFDAPQLSGIVGRAAKKLAERIKKINEHDRPYRTAVKKELRGADWGELIKT